MNRKRQLTHLEDKSYFDLPSISTHRCFYSHPEEDVHRMHQYVAVTAMNSQGHGTQCPHVRHCREKRCEKNAPMHDVIISADQ